MHRAPRQRFRWRAGAAISLLLAALSSGCWGSNTDPAEPNSTDPQWVAQHNPHASIALVFVHGIFGDTLGTWTSASGTGFFDLIKANPQIEPKVDVFAFGYTSNMLRSGSLDIQEAANTLHARLQFHGVLDYPAVVFVTHSMGGLVVLRELLTHRELLPKVPGLVLYSTPQEGAHITVIAQHVARNPALEQMLPADRNGYLRVLNDEWKSLPTRPKVACAYERKPTNGVMVVPWSSATRFCDGTAVAINADHTDIVKPDRAGHDSMVVLVNALNDFALGTTVVAKLETPDFVREGDHAVFTLADLSGRSAARLVNAGGTKLRYTIGPVSDSHLFIWPDDTPKELAGNTTERLQFGLGFGATASEYRFTLTTDVSGAQPIVVRVPDLAVVREQQLRLASDVSRELRTQLSDPNKLGRFTTAAAGNAEAPEAVVRAVRDVVARQNPNLPESATWILTADLADATNWPGLAVRALRHAEKSSPASARAPSVQRLAGMVGAHAGEASVFANATTPNPENVEFDRVQPLTDPRAAATSAELASLMQRVPALKAQGLSLQGDLQRARGDTEGARVTYDNAGRISMSPSIAARIGVVSGKGAPRNWTPVTRVVPR